MKPDWTLVTLWLVLALCGAALVAFLVLPAFGRIAATIAWLVMAIFIAGVVRALFRAANVTR